MDWESYLAFSPEQALEQLRADIGGRPKAKTVVDRRYVCDYENGVCMAFAGNTLKGIIIKLRPGNGYEAAPQRVAPHGITKDHDYVRLRDAFGEPVRSGHAALSVTPERDIEWTVFRKGNHEVHITFADDGGTSEVTIMPPAL